MQAREGAAQLGMNGGVGVEVGDVRGCRCMTQKVCSKWMQRPPTVCLKMMVRIKHDHREVGGIHGDGMDTRVLTRCMLCPQSHTGGMRSKLHSAIHQQFPRQPPCFV